MGENKKMLDPNQAALWLKSEAPNIPEPETRAGTNFFLKEVS
jgi:hypothetical protein